MCIKAEHKVKEVNMHRAQHGSISKKPKKNLLLKPLLVKPEQRRRSDSENHRPCLTVNQLLLSMGIFSNVVDVNWTLQDNDGVKEGTKGFISILRHSLPCRNQCQDIKCKKMKLVMHHYVRCTKLKNGQDCTLCRQLLRVIAEHALYLCTESPKLPCVIPLCDAMRAAAALSSPKTPN